MEKVIKREVNAVLDEIRLGIEDESYLSYDNNPRHILDEVQVLEIIDKYKAERSERNDIYRKESL